MTLAAARGIAERGALLYWSSVVPLEPLARLVLERRMAVALQPANNK